MVGHFTDPRVGAVAGNVKVGNTHQYPHALAGGGIHHQPECGSPRLRGVERRDRRARRGRRMAADGARGSRRLSHGHPGGRHGPHLAPPPERLEDRDGEPRRRLHRGARGSRASFSSSASAGAIGTLQCLWKHRGALFRYGWFGWVGLPTMWLFQIVFQILAPVADLQLLYALCAFASGWLNQHLHPADDIPTTNLYPMLIQTAVFYLVFYLRGTDWRRSRDFDRRRTVAAPARPFHPAIQLSATDVRRAVEISRQSGGGHARRVGEAGAQGHGAARRNGAERLKG